MSRARTRVRTAAELAALALIGVSILSCGPRRPIVVAVTFTTNWTFGGRSFDARDRALVEETALRTLREAFTGFAVDFVEQPDGDRVIRVEDTPAATNRHQLISFGATGVTYPFSRLSSVRIDVLFNNELAVLKCGRGTPCSKGEAELLEGLGRGVGATAAHELGHQAELGFTHDIDCADCYDGQSSTSYTHFFGVKHWSDAAMSRMKRVLPARSRSETAG